MKKLLRIGNIFYDTDASTFKCEMSGQKFVAWINEVGRSEERRPEYNQSLHITGGVVFRDQMSYRQDYVEYFTEWLHQEFMGKCVKPFVD